MASTNVTTPARVCIDSELAILIELAIACIEGITCDDLACSESCSVVHACNINAWEVDQCVGGGVTSWKARRRQGERNGRDLVLIQDLGVVMFEPQNMHPCREARGNRFKLSDG
ncbi:predicted protein [Histoplasma capsulatum G186AR]|uniref:Uncharacterized protein n=1 Tax=Ajellomyces capsulatus (strain G186AR / H82 / ATCC MYA-2454 / RMSCC 2432) TaxID=447093 RepID=C0NIR8_AJECG|nr:uncharacterized protein HCBG_02325 [Histoplasma capsulatum G186AR]EEH08788.1 predicted protein [Histoplasma capsulatum G186AR]